MVDEGATTAEPAWLRRQLLFTAIGTLLAVGGIAFAVAGLIRYPWQSGAATSYAVIATIGAGVLGACCLVNLGCWLALRAAADRGPVQLSPTLRVGSLIAHVTSYVAVLVGMFGALAASALAGWDSPSGVCFGICFLLIIFAQIAAGSQYLRTSGPPGTVPNHLRRLNRYVQSQR